MSNSQAMASSTLDVETTPAEAPSESSDGKAVKFQHHTLHFHYPAFDLLPRGKQPYIEQPKNVAYREEPRGQPLGLHVDDVDFFIRFATDHDLEEHRSLTDCESAQLPTRYKCRDMLSEIALLSVWPGYLHLHVLSYADEDDIYTRFLLTTKRYTLPGALTETQRIFEMNSHQLSLLLEGDESWVALLDDLLYRKSDRAYLCTRIMMAMWDENFLAYRENLWQISWDQASVRSVRQLLANRLSVECRTPDGQAWDLKPIYDLNDVRDQALEVWLPCAHKLQLGPNYIQNMSVSNALKSKCRLPDCGRRILTKEDDEALGCCYDRAKRYRFFANNHQWLSLDRRVRDDTHIVEITGSALADALFDALRPFDLLPSVTPTILNPTKYRETVHLLVELTSLLRNNEDLPAMTPKALFGHLKRLAENLLVDDVGDETLLELSLPPDFDVFLHRWLKRAVNCAVERLQAQKYKEEDALAELTECFGQTKLQAAEELHDEASKDGGMDEILQMLSSTRLGGKQEAGKGDVKNESGRGEVLKFDDEL